MPLKKRRRNSGVSGDGGGDGGGSSSKKKDSRRGCVMNPTHVVDDDVEASEREAKRMRTEQERQRQRQQQHENAKEGEDSDTDEDITLGQLGLQFLQAKASPIHVPPPSTVVVAALSATEIRGAAKVVTAAAATRRTPPPRADGGGGDARRSPSGSGAAIPSLTVTPLNTRARSPDNLTNGSGHVHSLFSPVSSTELRAPFLMHACEPISCDSDDKNDNNDEECGSIGISPVLQRSATLVRMAAATQPAISPATMWICIDDDDDDDGEIRVLSCQPSPAWRPSEGNAAPCLPGGNVQHQNQQSIPPRREPIAGVLPPTFRPRKGPLQANKPPPRAISPLPNGCFIYDDDFTSSEEDGEGMEKNDGNHQGEGTSVPPLQHQDRYLPSVISLSQPDTTMPMRSSTPLCITGRAYILDDDNSTASRSGSSSSSSSSNNNNSSTGLMKAEEGAQGETKKKKKKRKNIADDCREMQGVDLKLDNTRHSFGVTPIVLQDEEVLIASTDTCVVSPTRSVRDFLFPSRCRASTDWGDSSSVLLTTSAADSARAGGDLHTLKVRAVEKLRPLFPKRLTRRCFLSALETVVSKPHCLEAGEFWQAFDHVEYVGEGSFGLVWRCRTVDGDLVAVKSCPISFHSRGSIDDAFSVLREIAIMRFLGEHEVPYVLPLHSAFFVEGHEALPPEAVAAVEWRARLARAKEAEEEKQKQQQQQQQLGRRGRRVGQKKAHQCVQEAGTAAKTREATEEEMAERMRYEKIRLPRFLSISVEDAMKCDATAFLVTELCDGDLESIERHDGITKGVAFCVATALAAMHGLGLVHLDLKPSNILFAYENGPSHQQRLLQQQRQQQPQQHSLKAYAPDTPPILSQEQPIEAAVAVAHAANPPAPSPVKFYLSDFGNCRIIGPDMADEVTGVLGTFEYMDWRALQDKTCSRATDCFSLGATLYELLYSKRLYPLCKNPECTSDEDHTRHCYVEAALQPVTMAPTSPSAGILPKVTAGLLAQDQRERWTAERCRSFFSINDLAGAAAATKTTTPLP